jgi:hypothetical protein
MKAAMKSNDVLNGYGSIGALNDDFGWQRLWDT